MNSLMSQRSILFLMLVLSVSPYGYAESPVEMVTKANAVIHTLHRNGLLALLAVLITGLIGIVVAALQRWDGQHIKVVMIALGVITASLTFAANTVFDFTHKQYFARESKANGLILKMEKFQRQYEAAQPDQKDAIWDKLMSIYEEIESLKHEPMDAKPAAKSSALDMLNIGGFVSSAMADPNTIRDPDAPAWVTEPPVSENFYYFVGVADGYDLGVTKEKAQWNALAHTQNFLKFQLNDVSGKPQNGWQITSPLLRLTKENDEYFAFDKDTQTVRVYQLLSINKKSLERNAQYYATSIGFKNPDLVVDKLVNDEKAWEKHYADWATTTNVELDKYKSSMPPKGYTDVVRRRDNGQRSTIPQARINLGVSK
jgi:hypothetical protein